MSRRTVVFTLTCTPDASALRNPGSSVATVYVPTGRYRKLYKPSGPVVTVWVSPVFEFFAVTVAAGIAAPEGSVTAPVIVPRS